MTDHTLPPFRFNPQPLRLSPEARAALRRIAQQMQAPPAPTRTDFSPITRLIAGAAAGLREQMQEFGRGVRKMLDGMQPVLRLIREAANDPVHVEGIAATYRVRAALRFPTEGAVTALCGVIMRGEAQDPPVALLTRENRAYVAAAALQGWVHRHPAASDVEHPWTRHTGRRVELHRTWVHTGPTQVIRHQRKAG